jgi:hypothetical protein
VVGGSFWWQEDPPSFERVAKDEYLRNFCIDRSTFDAIQRKVAEARARNPDMTLLSYFDIRYILKTGRNWKGPIGMFRLTVDKGSAANLVSFCADGVTKSGPTTFVVERRNWEPDRDLAVLILQPAQ